MFSGSRIVITKVQVFRTIFRIYWRLFLRYFGIKNKGVEVEEPEEAEISEVETDFARLEDGAE